MVGALTQEQASRLLKAWRQDRCHKGQRRSHTQTPLKFAAADGAQSRSRRGFRRFVTEPELLAPSIWRSVRPRSQAEHRVPSSPRHRVSELPTNERGGRQSKCRHGDATICLRSPLLIRAASGETIRSEARTRLRWPRENYSTSREIGRAHV